MSSSEEKSTSPVLPKDSDRGSSVSSDLQDEYEELLRYAVVTPRSKQSSLQQSDHTEVLQTSSGKSPIMSDCRHEAVGIRWRKHGITPDFTSSNRTTRIKVSASIKEPAHMDVEGLFPIHSEGSSSEGSSSSQRDLQESYITDLSVTDERVTQIESILDLWSGSLKTNVLTELRKWKLHFIEHHTLELSQEREKHAAHVRQLTNQMENLKELLHCYEISTGRKDEVIANLTHAIEKQKDRIELMKRFAKWRLQHLMEKQDSRQEECTDRLANRLYEMGLLKKAWAIWRARMHEKWKEAMEKAVQTNAEFMRNELSNNYETKVQELNVALEEAKSEISEMQNKRQDYEDAIKTAFMRGVCALNLEAMSVFQGKDFKFDPVADSSENGAEPGAGNGGHAANFPPSQYDQTLPPTSSGSILIHLPPPLLPSPLLNSASAMAPDSAPTMTPGSAPTMASGSNPTMAPGSAPTMAPGSVSTIAPHSVPTMASHSVPTMVSHSVQTMVPHSVPTMASHSAPTMVPHSAPTMVPHSVPTMVSHSAPTMVSHSAPTMVPHSGPTMVSHSGPTMVSHSAQTMVPHSVPTMASHSGPTMVPHSAPTMVPHSVPTMASHSGPTMVSHSAQTMVPHSVPTMASHSAPTMAPHSAPTMAPHSAPTMAPHSASTMAPHSGPTMAPHSASTMAPHSGPTMAPHSGPTMAPHSGSTTVPHSGLTTAPHSGPTMAPRSGPTTAPRSGPTTAPRSGPTTAPRSGPTMAPHSGPTMAPRSGPTMAPRSGPTMAPRSVPIEDLFASHRGHAVTSQTRLDSAAVLISCGDSTGSGATSISKLPTGRVVTSAQQKAGRTVTARITGRSDFAPRNWICSNLDVLGVSPPMSSIVVEKHLPVTQQTICQATAAKYPRTSHKFSSAISMKYLVYSGKPHTQTHSNIHSIKVVE